jgi:hypothetical protein
LRLCEKLSRGWASVPATYYFRSKIIIVSFLSLPCTGNLLVLAAPES